MDHSLSFLHVRGQIGCVRRNPLTNGFYLAGEKRCLNFGNQTSHFVALLLFLYDFGRKKMDFCGYVSV